MTIETIKDVLGRILVINKSLTEESLKTLLDASGWDADDVREGLRIFRDYVASGNDMSKVSTSATILKQEINHDSIVVNPPAGSNQNVKENIGSREEHVVSSGFSSLGSPLSSSIIDLTQKTNKESHTPKVEISMPSIPNIPSLNVSVATPPTSSIQSISQNYNVPEDIHKIEEYIVSENSFKNSWLLIILNIILFIITFVILIYVIVS